MFEGIRKTSGGQKTPYFYDPVLAMSYTGRLTARMVSHAWVAVHAAITFITLLSDIQWVFWFGVMSTLYLLDQLAHFGRPDYDMSVHREAENTALFLTPRARQALITAYNRASLSGGSFFLHAARTLVDDRSVVHSLARLEVRKEELIGYLEGEISRQTGSMRRRERLLAEAEHLAVAAYTARTGADRYLDSASLFAALGAVGDERLGAMFNLLDIRGEDLRQAVIFERLRRRRRGFSRRIVARRPRRIRHRVMNRAWTARPTPTLDRLGRDLTDLARAGQVGFLIGHAAEYRRLVNNLSDPTTPNAVLVGEAGVGKTAIVEHLAEQIVRDNVPRQLFDKRVVMLDVGALVAGANPAALQGKVRKVFEEIERAGNIILFIPNIHILQKTTGEADLTVAETTLPLLKERGIPTIGTATPKEFKQLLEPMGQFHAAFEVIRVEEVTPGEAEEILIYRSAALEGKHGVEIAFSAIRTAVRLAESYFRDTPLPTSAEELLKETVAFVKNRNEGLVSGDDVIRVAEERTASPIREAEGKEAGELLHLEEKIHERLVNQEEAVRAVSDALRAARSGLGEKEGPIGTFLFVGPTGVGKTELAKALAEVHFGSEGAMVRFDMSEYQEEGSIERFIGSPDGKIPGALTGAVRERPYRLILLDEFEKANPDVLKLFLQVFDDGRLTDGLGRVVRFKESIIIATSNAEANFIKESIEEGKSMHEIKTELSDRLARLFSPELLNRFTDVIVFRSLGRQEIEAIARLRLLELAGQVKEARGVELRFEDEAVRQIASLGYDPVFGARPLERVIREQLKGRLSEKILAGDLKRGAEATVRVENGVLDVHEGA